VSAFQTENGLFLRVPLGQVEASQSPSSDEAGWVIEIVGPVL
jgi:hypothetical protein